MDRPHLATLRSFTVSSISSIRRKLHIEKPPHVIVAKPVQRWLCYSPSLAVFGNDILLMILEFLHDEDPRSVLAMKRVCSQLYHLALYVSMREKMLHVIASNFEDTWTCKDPKMSSDAMAAVRVLKVSTQWQGTLDAKGFKDLKSIEFEELLTRMPGLIDVHLPRLHNTVEVLRAVSKFPRLRLHLNTGGFNYGVGKDLHDSFPSITQLSDRLTSLHVETSYYSSGECLSVTRPVKDILMICPNLKHLTLGICSEIEGNQHAALESYSGFGFGIVEGERPLCALESLDISGYPFLTDWQRQQSTESLGHLQDTEEIEYWAQNFNWTRLKSLRLSKQIQPQHILPLARHLTALKTLDTGFAHHHHPTEQTPLNPVSAFYASIPSLLTNIAAQSLSAITLPTLLRHGRTLRHLTLHQLLPSPTPDFANLDTWDVEPISASDLCTIAVECPHISSLSLWLTRDGTWPFDILDALATFPSLRDLVLGFQQFVILNGEPTILDPLITTEAVQWGFDYLVERGRWAKMSKWDADARVGVGAGGAGDGDRTARALLKSSLRRVEVRESWFRQRNECVRWVVEVAAAARKVTGEGEEEGKSWIRSWNLLNLIR